MTASLRKAELEALSSIRSAFPKQRLALVGAAALGFHIPMRWRRTEDLDLVVAVSIDQASRLMAALSGWSQDPRKEHQWRSPQGVLVDILPVSRKALAERALLWPGSGFSMSLVGIRHAFSSPLTQLAKGLALCVSTVPVIALLKMVSFLDRPSERERDLTDLAHIMNEYPTADDDRLFEAGIRERGLTLETALPFVLGRELAGLVDDIEADAVSRFIERARGPSLPRFAANGPWSRFDLEQSESRLDALAKGFSTRSRAKSE